MPPRPQIVRFDSPSERLALPYQDRCYWMRFGTGQALGYARLIHDGTWSARTRTKSGRYLQERLGAADDFKAADGVEVLSFEQAIARAKERFAVNKDRSIDPRPVRDRPLQLLYSPVGPVYTVCHAIADYLEYQTQYKSRSRQILYSVNAHILPELGPIAVADLTPMEIRRWLARLSVRPLRLRASRGYDVTYGAAPRTEEELRRRKNSANRMLMLLKSALTMAVREGKAKDDTAWRVVLAFKKVDDRPIRALTLDQCRALIREAQDDLRLLVLGALYSGARVTELTSLLVGDIDIAMRQVLIRRGKGGKHRHIALPDEGVAFFEAVTHGRPVGDLVFRELDGSRWIAGAHLRKLREACLAAQIEPAINFHNLRHTYASLLAMAGIPLIAIARQLGHSDIRTVVRHYAHFVPSYFDELLRERFPRILAPEPGPAPIYIR